MFTEEEKSSLKKQISSFPQSGSEAIEGYTKSLNFLKLLDPDVYNYYKEILAAFSKEEYRDVISRLEGSINEGIHTSYSFKVCKNGNIHTFGFTRNYYLFAMIEKENFLGQKKSCYISIAPCQQELNNLEVGEATDFALMMFDNSKSSFYYAQKAENNLYNIFKQNFNKKETKQIFESAERIAQEIENNQ